MRDIIILAGGSSVREMPQNTVMDHLPKLAYTIGVNDAALYANVNLAMSMDRLWCENRWQRVVEERGIALHARSEALKNVPLCPLITKYRCDYRSTAMTNEPGILNGTNSGMVAMNFAFQKRPQRVFLLGLDSGKTKGQTAPYWYPPYPWAADGGATKPGKYRDWNAQYTYVRRQFDRENIEMYTVGATKTEAFVNISFRQFILMVSENGKDKADLSVLQQSVDVGAAN